MELSSAVENDIRRLNDSLTLSDNHYDQLLEKLFAILTLDNGKADGLPNTFDKRLVSSILTFLFECVKNDLDETSIRSKFDEIQMSNKSRQDRFLALYKQHFPTLQLYLKRNSIEHDRLLNLDWRLDFQLKTNNTDKLFEPIYLLNWTKRQQYSEKIDQIQMTCTQENLQELVEKLKDAQTVLHQMQYQQSMKK